MALAFAHSRFFVGSTIIGATNMTQLKINIDSINVKLPDELLAEIEDIHSNNPYTQNQALKKNLPCS